MVDGVQFTFFG